MQFDLVTLLHQLQSMFSGNGLIIAALAAAIAYLQWMKPKAPITPVPPINVTPDASSPKEDPAANAAADDRLTAVQAVDFLTDYFDEHGYVEGRSAAEAVGPHLFKIPHKPLAS